MNKYIVKNQNNKQNKNVFGITDYDIPMFGFKSELVVLHVDSVLLIPSISLKEKKDYVKTFGL